MLVCFSNICYVEVWVEFLVGIVFSLAWENSRHFTTPLLVSPRNHFWGTNAEIPYWWRITTQTWVVLLIGRAAYRKFASTNQKHNPDLVSDTWLVWSFCAGFSEVRHFEGKPVVVSGNVGCFLRLCSPSKVIS